MNTFAGLGGIVVLLFGIAASIRGFLFLREPKNRTLRIPYMVSCVLGTISVGMLSYMMGGMESLGQDNSIATLLLLSNLIFSYLVVLLTYPRGIESEPRLLVKNVLLLWGMSTLILFGTQYS